MLLFWINVYLSQNWHLFCLISPTTKKSPLSTQACQTLYRQPRIPQRLENKLSELSPNLTRQQTRSFFQLPFSYCLPTCIAYRMMHWVCPQSHTALLMKASCFSQAKICWNTSRYLFTPDALMSQCTYKNLAVRMTAVTGRCQRMAGKRS